MPKSVQLMEAAPLKVNGAACGPVAAFKEAQAHLPATSVSESKDEKHLDHNF